MNPVKKFILLSASMLSLIVTAYSQPSFLISAGASLQNHTGETAEGIKLSNDYKIAGRAGASLEINLEHAFFLNPGLVFSIKGAENVNNIKNQDATVYYLEVPLILMYKSSISSGSLLAGIGPYFAYALDGKYTFAGGSEDIIFTGNVDIDDGVPYLKRYDYGAVFTLGYDFPFRLRFVFDMQLGILNLEPKIQNRTPKANTKNTGYSFSLGYRF